MCQDDAEERIAAAKRLARVNRQAAAEALRSIATDQGIGDDIRIEAATQLPGLDNRSAGVL